MTITYATGVGGYSARRFVCTHNDPLCSDSAVVIVLEDGRWYGDALCADHAPTSALRSLAAAEAGKGACTPPPAAAEVPPTNQHQGEHEPAPAPAGGGDSAISERTTDLYPYASMNLTPEDIHYLVVGVETGYDPHRTLHGAVADAEGRIDDCLDDTWSEEVDEILVARVTHRAVRNVMGRRADMTPEAWTELTGGRTDVDEWWSYSLEPVDQLDAGAPAALAETVEPTETEGQGAVSASPAPAPGGPICKTTVPAGTPMVAVPMAEWTELVETYDACAWLREPMALSREVIEAVAALIDASRGVA